MQLREGCRRHGTCAADLRLTAALRAADGGVRLDKIADDAARRERVENLGIRKAAAFLHIQKNARQHAAGTARGRGDDDAARRIFFADGVGIGAHKAVFARFGAFIDVILTVEHFRFALHV